MNLLHFRYENRLGLLAQGLLGATEAEQVSEHVAGCASCQSELAELKRVSAVLSADASLERALPISSAALRTRVLARIHSAAPERAHRAFGFSQAFTAIGLIGIGMLSGMLVARLAPASLSSPSPSTPSVESQIALAPVEEHAEATANNAAFYERFEKTRARANAVRYLTEAQDVLIQVTAASSDCPNSLKDSVDVTNEAQTSRSLLRRRAALVSGSEETLVAARGVLEEVEGVLQQVAELQHCTRRKDVDAIARRVDQKNLLMKIDLMTQELAAP